MNIVDKQVYRFHTTRPIMIIATTLYIESKTVKLKPTNFSGYNNSIGHINTNSYLNSSGYINSSSYINSIGINSIGLINSISTSKFPSLKSEDFCPNPQPDAGHLIPD